MNYIEVTNVNAGSTIENLAVTKGSFPVYFYLDIGKNLDDGMTATASSFSAEAGHGLTLGDYIKVNDEIMYVNGTFGTKTVFVDRAKRRTTSAAHSSGADIYKEYDHLTKVELNGADDPIPESQTVIDLENSSWYDITLGIKVVNVTDNNSGTAITVYYAFDGHSDIPLTDAGETSLALSEQTAKAVTLPDGTLNLYYTTDKIFPTARYMYLWCESDGAVVQTNSCDFYIIINQG